MVAVAVGIGRVLVARGVGAGSPGERRVAQAKIDISNKIGTAQCIKKLGVVGVSDDINIGILFQVKSEHSSS